MIDNFEHLYTGQDIKFKFSDKYSSVYLKLDSSNYVYDVRFESSRESCHGVLNLISSYIVDRHIDKLINSLANEVKDLTSTHLHKFDAIDVEYSILLFRNSLRHYVGKFDVESTQALNSEQLICRCAKTDLNLFEEMFLNSKGKKNEMIMQTNVSSFCTKCSDLVDGHFKLLEEKHKFLKGEKIDFWLSRIISLVSDFKIHENDSFKVAVSKIDIPKVDLIIENASSDDLNLIKRSLTHEMDKTLPFRSELNFEVVNNH